MPQIGHFTRTSSGYSGSVRTVSLDLEITFVPDENADVENAPAYPVHLGDEDRPEIGVGWKHTGDHAGSFISVVLDDPMFPHSVRVRLFQWDEDGRDWDLHWTRQKKREEQE
ncbi:DUF736 domain-containing protein [Mesorhizobium sp. B2-7-1]|uniref:DUF736 domain-containing protein n=1 Tax=Mesorhizobium sp. B2-7-1 TaxID=2589909 RepID=UPI00112DAD50|nr:DUF736 domain-containing protein [Mesorhizobium sp. B2-7-1]TPJ73057.1 DUF736 domain-containing protein [Mesorhizobium sp. B2-7-1]